MTYGEMKTLFDQAYSAGMQAMKAATPKPIVVGHATSVFSDEIDYSRPTYVVPSGLCGFAWVNIRPGNSKFARWLVKEGLGRKSYSGGVDFWVREGDQSVELKEAFAQAFAEELQSNGIKAYAESRLD